MLLLFFFSRKPSFIAKKTDVKLDFDKITDPLDHAGCKSFPTYYGVSRPLGYLPARIQSKIKKKAVVTKAKR